MNPNPTDGVLNNKSDRKCKNNCFQKCEYLFSAIALIEFSETLLFLQTSLYV